MRRSLFATFGVAAMLVLAACSPDQSSDRSLAPTEPLLAPGGGSPLCSGNAASNIAKNEKLLFTGSGLSAIQDQFTLIKNACPINEADATELGYLLGYFQLMIDNRTADNAGGLADHLNNVAAYAREAGSLGVQASAFRDSGGADVLTVSPTTTGSGDALVSFDKGVQLAFKAGTQAITEAGTVAFGSRLFTLAPLSPEECGDITGLRTSTRGAGAPCYDIVDYPDASEYTPAATLTICMHKSADENYGIVHENKKNNFGDEVLPRVELDPQYDCTDFHSGTSTSWLERKGGPLGKALARAYGFLSPKTLFADDAGESGSLGFFSKVGGILNDTFEDDFNDSTTFNPNPANDAPDLADGNWIYSASSPGFIRIQNALGNLSGGVLVLSQGQGACNNCPVFKLLGEVTTVDETNQTGEVDREINGSFEISWKELQSKPSVKEAPFMLLNNTLNNNNNNLSSVEIARVSHVSQSSQNRLLFKVLTDEGCPPGPNTCVRTFDVGTWNQNQSQTFKIILNLATLNPDSANRIALFVDNVEKVNVKALNATGFKLLGYVLTGIDAGIIGSDDWFVTRRADKPKPPTP